MMEKRHYYFLMGFCPAIMPYIDNIDQEGLSVQAKEDPSAVQDDLLSSFKHVSASHNEAENLPPCSGHLNRSDPEHLRNYNIRIEITRYIPYRSSTITFH
jgi:hypothetical protein